MTAIPTTALERIDACLPQTQCTQCGFACCRDYAAAIRRGATGINRCPPGGDATITALARLTGQPLEPLNPAVGAQQPRRVARIREPTCIGCTLCIKACPTDAIVGAGKLMHTIITADCTGCARCVPPCPMDCIDMIPAPALSPARRGHWPDYTDTEVARFRRLAARRLTRLAQPAPRGAAPAAPATRRAEIAAAVARARARHHPGPRS